MAEMTRFVMTVCTLVYVYIELLLKPMKILGKTTEGRKESFIGFSPIDQCHVNLWIFFHSFYFGFII